MSRLKLRMRSILGVGILLGAICGFSPPVPAQAPLLELSSSEVYPGQTGVPFELRLSHVGSVEGIEIGLAPSSSTVLIAEVILNGGVLEGLDLEFSSIQIDPDGQAASILWTLDSSVPFTTFLSPGDDQLLATVICDIDEDFLAASTVLLEFVDGVGTPPATNTVHSSSVALTPQTTAGTITGFSSNHFSFDTLPAFAGELDHLVDVVVNNSVNVQGFSLAITYDPAILNCTSFGIEDTITDVTGAEFVEEIINVVPGQAILGVLLDVIPPYNSQMIPASGLALPFAKLRFEVSETVTSNVATPIRFTDNIGTPPIENLLVIAGSSVLPVTVDTFLPIRGIAIFLRGDADGSLDLDLADVIQSVFYVTNQCPECPPITCMVALDANDDGGVDIAD